MPAKKLADNPNIDLTFVNAANNQPVVYTAEPAVLSVTLTNNTGGSIGLLAGSQPSTFEIFLPGFYQLSDLKNMQIDLPGWTFSVNAGDESLMLTCSQADTWANNAAISFNITNAESAQTPPQGSAVQVNPSGMSGNNIPAQVISDAPLMLQTPSNNNKAELTTVLELSLENEGKIYVSLDSNTLIPNILSLNIKNTSSQPLYTGSGPWNANPQVLVYFVYGGTSGALAPDGKSTPQNESAWNIQPGNVISEGNNWSFNPDNSGQINQPEWLLVPNPTNPGIIGVGNEANITFPFTQIVSLTPTGNTQMYVQFSDFPGYNDCLFTLNIEKDNAPPPGLLSFSSQVSMITVNSSKQQVNIPLNWSMFDVNSIAIQFVIPGLSIPPYLKSYGDVLGSLNDSHTAVIEGITESTTLEITCIAYDGNGVQLNDMQQSVSIDFPPIVTSYQADLQQDGSLLLTWTTEGASQVTLNATSEILGPNKSFVVESPQFPLLNNDYYALTASSVLGVSSNPYLLTRVLAYGEQTVLKDVGREPMGIAISPDGSNVYVSNADGTLSIIQVDSTPPFNMVNVALNLGSNPFGIAVSADGKYAFVVAAEQDNSYYGVLSVIGLDSNPPQVVQSINVVPQSKGVAISPDGNYIFVSDSAMNTIAVIEVNSTPAYNLLQVITVGENPMGIAVSPDGAYVFVTNMTDATVSVIEVNGNPAFNVVQTVTVGETPIGITVSPDGNNVYVANAGAQTVSVIAVNSDPPFTVQPTLILTGEYPLGIAASQDGAFVFVTNAIQNSVTVIEVQSTPPFKTAPMIPAGMSPGGITISPDGMYVFVANANDNTVSVIGPVSAAIEDSSM